MPNWLITAELLAMVLVVFVGFPAFAGGDGSGKVWYQELVPICLLLCVVAFIIYRLPKIEEEKNKPGQLAHREVPGFNKRRILNWLALGFTYAFLYWGRYNITDTIIALGGKGMYKDFNHVFAVGTAVYGLSFLVNGPLTDRFGGRFSILVGALGAAGANALMGLSIVKFMDGTMAYDELRSRLVILYGVNMYFQSFGAVAIVKCNSAWFHVRERGVFGAIFGILIAMGIYFAFDWTRLIVKDWELSPYWACFAPAAALGIMFVISLFTVRNKPSDAGYKDFNTGDATSGDEPADKKQKTTGFKETIGSVLGVYKGMLQKHPVQLHIPVKKLNADGQIVKEVQVKETFMRVVVFIALVEFCSGFLRQAVMQQFRGYAKSMELMGTYVYVHWGMVLCMAGILGGVFAGTISDHFFQSRRGPAATLLYLGLLVGSVAACFMLGNPMIGWLFVFMSLCVIGVHGMLSGTASMDFGGTKNVGIAVGIIDGFVYFGSSLQSWIYSYTLPEGDSPLAKDPNNWYSWPIAMIVFAAIGLVFAYHIRNVRPKSKEKKVEATG